MELDEADGVGVEGVRRQPARQPRLAGPRRAVEDDLAAGRQQVEPPLQPALGQQEVGG